MTATEFNNLQDKEKITSLKGTVAKVWPADQQTPGQRKYGIHNQSIQVILDDGQEVKFKFKSPQHHMDSSAEGRVIEVAAKQGMKGPQGLGISRYNDKNTLEIEQDAMVAFVGEGAATRHAAPARQGTTASAAAAPQHGDFQWPTLAQFVGSLVMIHEELERQYTDSQVSEHGYLPAAAASVWAAIPIHMRFPGSDVLRLEGQVARIAEAAPAEADEFDPRFQVLEEKARSLGALATPEAAQSFKASLYPELGVEGSYRVLADALKDLAPDAFERAEQDVLDLATASAENKLKRPPNREEMLKEILRDPLTFVNMLEKSDDIPF